MRCCGRGRRTGSGRTCAVVPATRCQYFSAIEAATPARPAPARRPPRHHPPLHIKAVVAATYYAAWWPALDRDIHRGHRLAIFDRDTGRYVDPGTGVPLPTWEEATEGLDEPTHVASFGKQVDIKGLPAGTVDSDRAIRYLCKYLTKNVADT